MASFCNLERITKDQKYHLDNSVVLALTMLIKVFPNKNYILLKINFNKSQVLHRIILPKYNSKTPLAGSYNYEKFRTEVYFVGSQCGLYKLA